MNRLGSVIAAVSTPPGKGGIAVIRISGPGAADITDKVFRPKNEKSLLSHAPRTAVYGDIAGEDGIIDDGLAVYFPAPNSYTGEDTVEISCHGGILLTQLVLEAVFAAGALPAEPGEFTKRAYISGKLGLIKAESVIDLIDAESRESVKLASSQSRGALGGRIDDIYNKMKQLLSSIYAYIDFPDEDLTDVPGSELLSRLSDIRNEVDSLASTWKTGRAVKDGISACIAGKPNVGKSSLLNALLGYDRAIVTDIAGTTRDIVSEKVSLGRASLKLSDTAGIHKAEDIVERIGVDRAVEELEKSELILAVFDGSQPLDSADSEFAFHIGAARKNNPSVRVIAVINKSDLPAVFNNSEIKKLIEDAEIIRLSACSGNVTTLAELIDRMFIDGSLDLSNDAIISNARQYAALIRAREDLDSALKSLKSGFTQDIAGLDVEHAMSNISEIDGLSVSEDIVDDIFHRFCVGK